MNDIMGAQSHYISHHFNFSHSVADKIYRHTAGRISSLVRIPIYLLGLTFQGIKIACKGLAALVTSATSNKKAADSIILSAEKDALMWLKLADKTLNSVFGFGCAPPKNYYGLDEGIEQTLEIVFFGDYHEQTRLHPRSKGPTTLGDVYVELMTRPKYSQLIFDTIEPLRAC